MFKNKSKKIILIFVFLLIFIFNLFAVSNAIYLDLGKNGEEVVQIQQYLNKIGYQIQVDGVYGVRTKDKVIQFQKEHNLNPDGIVGEKTFNFLQNLKDEIKYTVRKGDCLSKIALEFNSQVQEIMNRNNLNSEKIVIGQELFIPMNEIGGVENGNLMSMISYNIRKGDSLSSLARQYNTTVRKIKEVNNLYNDNIYAGEELKIPVKNSSSGSIVWPVMGRISSGYGYRQDPITYERKFHGGIDIAIPIGTEIRTISNGTVVWSGWVDGFGKTIIIDHNNGLRSLYAHNSKLLVASGTKVYKNQVICLSGNTGRSTGPHLDFRIYLNGKTIDPKRYLPKI
jgi:murein DD-endopeptidase MepM/ murein hydrolase activator NlpD